MQINYLLLLATSTLSIASPVNFQPVDPIDVQEFGGPSPNATSTAANGTHIEKRATYGWLAAFQDWDFLCKAGYTEPRPEVRTDCINLTPAGANIGINWGTSLDAFSSLDVFSHADCINKVATIRAPARHHRDGVQTCWNKWEHQVASFRSSNQGP